MTSDLLMAIRKIEGIDINNSNYASIYLFATENISGFTSKLPFSNKKILTVCSSGDQTFNLIFNDALEIDLFDINIFSKYYFELKKAAINSLEREEFFDFFFNKPFKNNVFNFEIYLKIRDYILDDKIRYFWDYLFCHYKGIDLYYSNLFHKINCSKNTIIEYNDYLANKENYNKLKFLLKDKKFNFYNFDLFKNEIPNKNKYDFVYLSNIFDYLNIGNEVKYTSKIKEIIDNIRNNNLTHNGIITVSYLYLYLDDTWYIEEGLKSELFRNIYFNDDYEYIQFSGFGIHKDNQIRNKDALMLYKKKD